MEKKNVSPSPLDSRVSLVGPYSPSVHTLLVETPRQSFSAANGTDSAKAAIDKEYLKNVLVQFFEHKDKRVSLIQQCHAYTLRLNYFPCCQCCLICQRLTNQSFCDNESMPSGNPKSGLRRPVRKFWEFHRNTEVKIFTAIFLFDFISANFAASP